MKYVYRALILFGIFLCSVFFFGREVTKQTVGNRKTVEMADATHPLVEIKTSQETINLMHGYTGNLSASNFRDSIVPVNSSKEFTIVVKENTSEVKKIIYTISEVKSGSVVETGSVSALDQSKNQKSTKVKIKAELQQGREYSLAITTVTSTSKKIHFFTRLKRIEDLNLKGQLEFIKKFHEATFDKEKFKGYVSYLEATPSNDTSSLAKVTISSPSDLISWADYKVKIKSSVVPTVKEINSEIISVELAYTAEINKKDYEVNEFYRIRYSSSRIYLLSYQRTVESRFSLADVDFKEKEINLGMTSENPDVTVSDNGERMSFVADGSLWYYNMKDNKAYSVFSFMDSDQDYEREGYDQHNIRILNVRDNGEVNFLVYGYMNRGDYEGKLGIILYRFYEKEDRIEEMLFIPVTQNYEALESTLDKFSYLSGQDIYYFSMNNVIYAYNIITKAKQEIASNIAKNSFVLSDTGHFIAWQDSNQIKNSTAITMLNLETGERKKIKAGSGERIRVLGTVDVNLIYGFVDSSKVSTKADGSTFTPIKKIELMSNVGTVVKKYEKSNYYVTKVQVNDNVIELTRVKEGLSGYEKAKADFIMTKIPEESIIVTVKDKKKDKHISERVITLPDALKIKKNPSVVTAKNTVITMDTVLHLSDSETSGKQYYVVALGHVQNSYDQAGDAIKKADSLMGVVVDAEGNVIWERGEMNASGNVATVTAIHTSNIVNAKGAVTAMLLKAAGQSANAENLSKKSDSLYSLINKNVKGGAINLTGSNLEQALYYVSKGRPVVALKDNKQPVLITKYDSFNVTFIDPSTHTVKKMGRNSATAYFKSAGNVFISYIN